MPARKRAAALCVFAVATAVTVFGQSESASVVGTVTDSSGASIPGAAVSIRDTRTNASFTAQSAQDGNYTSPPLRPGSYEVSVEASGFSRMVQTLNLDVDQRAQNALVVVQVALAFVLLVASGLVIRSFLALRALTPGFTHPEWIQTVRIAIPEALAAESERRAGQRRTRSAPFRLRRVAPPLFA